MQLIDYVAKLHKIDDNASGNPHKIDDIITQNPHKIEDKRVMTS